MDMTVMIWCLGVWARRKANRERNIEKKKQSFGNAFPALLF